MEPVKISELELENVKRVKAVTLEPTPNGLTVIGGRNNQGKTSVLDAIAWALGGNKLKPSSPVRDGAAGPTRMELKLSNGLRVERSGSGSLKVIDPEGNKSGQALLDAFVGTLALDLPKFMQSTDKEKASTLLQIIGVGDELDAIEKKERELYEERTVVGRMRDQKQHAADDMPSYPEAPEEAVSASELIAQQQDILARNGENQRKREHVGQMEAEARAKDETLASIIRHADDLRAQLKELERRLTEVRDERTALASDIATARKTAEELEDESTEELEGALQEIDAINAKVRTNQAKAAAQAEALSQQEEYDTLTQAIEEVRKSKSSLLEGAELPLPGLSVESGALTYTGRRWDSMSGSDQLKVATAIVRKLNPQCGFVLMDKLEQMDVDTLREFGTWAAIEGLQIIATRVSTGGECSVIIEDGHVLGSPTEVEAATWKAGEF